MCGMCGRLSVQLFLLRCGGASALGVLRCESIDQYTVRLDKSGTAKAIHVVQPDGLGCLLSVHDGLGTCLPCMDSIRFTWLERK